jgi:hypothetical protein
MPGGRDPVVDAYVAALPPWQRDLCADLRQMIRAADPDIEETTKRGGKPYYVLDGNVCAILATKDHVNLFLYDPDVPDPAGLVNQGHDNKTARAIQIYEGDPVDRDAVVEIVRAIAARNRAGGWRRLS